MDERKHQHQQKKPASPKAASKQGVSDNAKKQPKGKDELNDKQLDKVSGGAVYIANWD